MITAESIQYELYGRFDDLAEAVGKHHLSVRWESAPRVARVGAMLENYDWDSRMKAIEVMYDFQKTHADEFAVEYDILPLDAVTDESFAED